MNTAYVFVVLFNLSFWLAWPILSILMLRQLRHTPLSDVAQAIWAFTILVVPIFGALAFWIVRPGEENAVG